MAQYCLTPRCFVGVGFDETLFADRWLGMRGRLVHASASETSAKKCLHGPLLCPHLRSSVRGSRQVRALWASRCDSPGAHVPACAQGFWVGRAVLGSDRVNAGLLHVSCIKGWDRLGAAFAKPELRALRRLQKDAAAYVFTSERSGPMTTDNVRKLVQKAGQEARIAIPVHRIGCGMPAATSSPTTTTIHAGDSAVSGTCQHSAHGARYGAEPAEVQGF